MHGVDCWLLWPWPTDLMMWPWPTYLMLWRILSSMIDAWSKLLIIVTLTSLLDYCDLDLLTWCCGGSCPLWWMRGVDCWYRMPTLLCWPAYPVRCIIEGYVIPFPYIKPNTSNIMYKRVASVKHILFVGPYFHETTHLLLCSYDFLKFLQVSISLNMILTRENIFTWEIIDKDFISMSLPSQELTRHVLVR